VEWLQVGVDIGSLTPQVSGVVTRYSVQPALPAGLSLDATTGAVTGTPLTATTQATYEFRASNDGGSVAFSITMAVDAPLSGLSYAGPVQATVDTPITELTPTVNGLADQYDILPRLPPGLSLDAATGTISGTPTVARVLATYSVSATDTHIHSSTTFPLQLVVNPPPPGTVATGVFRDSTVTGLGYHSGSQSGVTDSHGQFSYEQGQSITFFVGGVSLGTAANPGAMLTPVDLISSGTGTSTYVVNVVRFLMLLDTDGDPGNGIQISPAVTAAAASWPALDFNSTDLPTALGAIIQQASIADGVAHVLPGAMSAQAQLRDALFCASSGVFVGTYAADPSVNERDVLSAVVLPDGSVGTLGLIASTGALDPSLDLSFASMSQSPSARIDGRFSDPDFLSGTYTAATSGTFGAARIANTPDARYRFTGTFDICNNDYGGCDFRFSGFAVLSMDDAGNISGTAYGHYLGRSSGSRWQAAPVSGSVSGATFAGSIYGYDIAGSFTSAGLAITASGGGSSSIQSRLTVGGCRVN
jgi:hypothetical protein